MGWGGTAVREGGARVYAAIDEEQHRSGVVEPPAAVARPYEEDEDADAAVEEPLASLQREELEVDVYQVVDPLDRRRERLDQRGQAVGELV